MITILFLYFLIWHSTPHKLPTTNDNNFISLFPDVLWLNTIFCHIHRFKATGHHVMWGPTLLPHNKCRYAAAATPQTISWKSECQLGIWSVVTQQC